MSCNSYWHFVFLLQYLSANRMDTSRVRRMIGLLWFAFFFVGVLAEGTLEKLHEGEYSFKFFDFWQHSFLISKINIFPFLFCRVWKEKNGT